MVTIMTKYKVYQRNPIVTLCIPTMDPYTLSFTFGLVVAFTRLQQEYCTSKDESWLDKLGNNVLSYPKTMFINIPKSIFRQLVLQGIDDSLPELNTSQGSFSYGATILHRPFQTFLW